MADLRSKVVKMLVNSDWPPFFGEESELRANYNVPHTDVTVDFVLFINGKVIGFLGVAGKREDANAMYVSYREAAKKLPVEFIGEKELETTYKVPFLFFSTGGQTWFQEQRKGDSESFERIFHFPSPNELKLWRGADSLEFSLIPFYGKSPWQVEEPDLPVYPFFAFRQDAWNDYGYETTFHVEYHKSETEKIQFPKLKILQRDSLDNRTQLPDKFSSLDHRYFSLGQEENYYELIKEHFPSDYRRILWSLRDVAYFPKLLEIAEELPGFRTSLLRVSNANRALSNGKKLVDGLAVTNQFAFQFSTLLEGAAAAHTVDFLFASKEKLPSRIILLVGKNGTGKTQYLAKLAHALSGNESGIHDHFTPVRPPIGRVLAISYSMFDKFNKPESSFDFSYRYCGIMGERGILQEDALAEKLMDASEEIKKQGRVDEWTFALSEIIAPEHLQITQSRLLSGERVNLFSASRQNKLSSGQSILLFVITELVAYLREGSLVTYDEPEMHLHPNAISRLMKVLNLLLNRFDSYAVVATHSPLLAQEVPAKFIRIFDRQDDVPMIRAPKIETFGEDLTTLTDEIFETNAVRGAYKEVFEELVKNNYGYQGILGMFEQELPVNARIYLKSLLASKA